MWNRGSMALKMELRTTCRPAVGGAGGQEASSPPTPGLWPTHPHHRPWEALGAEGSEGDPEAGKGTVWEGKRGLQGHRLPPTGHPRHQAEGSEHAEGPQGLDVQAGSLAAHGGCVALDDVHLLQDHGEDPEAGAEEGSAVGRAAVLVGWAWGWRQGLARGGRFGPPPANRAGNARLENIIRKDSEAMCRLREKVLDTCMVSALGAEGRAEGRGPRAYRPQPEA